MHFDPDGAEFRDLLFSGAGTARAAAGASFARMGMVLRGSRRAREVPPALFRISKSESEDEDGVAGSESWSLM